MKFLPVKIATFYYAPLCSLFVCPPLLGIMNNDTNFICQHCAPPTFVSFPFFAHFISLILMKIIEKKFKHLHPNWPFRTVYIFLFLFADGSSDDGFVFAPDIDALRHLGTSVCTLIGNAPSTRRYNWHERWFCMRNISSGVHVSVDCDAEKKGRKKWIQM